MKILKDLQRYFKVLFVFLFVCVVSFTVYGCGDPQTVFYFSFKSRNFNMEVGQEIMLEDINISSNLQTYEHMHMFCEDEEIAKIFGFKITAQKEGTTKITLAGFENGQYLHDYFYLTVSASSGEGNNEGSNLDPSGEDSTNPGGEGLSTDPSVNPGGEGTSGEDAEGGNSGETEELIIYIDNYEFLEDEGEFIYSFNVYKNESLYQNIAYSFVKGKEDVLSHRKTGGNIEIVCSSNAQISVMITDNITSKSITVNLPKE